MQHEVSPSMLSICTQKGQREGDMDLCTPYNASKSLCLQIQECGAGAGFKPTLCSWDRAVAAASGSAALGAGPQVTSGHFGLKQLLSKTWREAAVSLSPLALVAWCS